MHGHSCVHNFFFLEAVCSKHMLRTNEKVCLLALFYVCFLISTPLHFFCMFLKLKASGKTELSLSVIFLFVRIRDLIGFGFSRFYAMKTLLKAGAMKIECCCSQLDNPISRKAITHLSG